MAIRAAIGLFSLCLATTGALAQSAETNRLTIDGQPDGHSAAVSIEGDFNTVAILQRGPAAPSHGGLFDPALSSSRNGGGASVESRLAGRGGAPLTGQGLYHRARLTVSGAANSVSLTQSGRAHQTTGSVSGRSNAASITQVGKHHRAFFSQSGNGNILSITQRSR